MPDAFNTQARDLALLESSDMIRDLFPDADLMARTASEQFAVLSFSPLTMEAELGVRTSQWVQSRAGQHSANQAGLQFDVTEIETSADQLNLAEILRQPAAMSISMQE